MAGIEGNYNFFLKKLPPEIVNGGVGGVQGTQGVGSLGQAQNDAKAEAKKQEIAKITEDAMQELQIEEGTESNLFLDDVKKKISS